MVPRKGYHGPRSSGDGSGRGNRRGRSRDSALRVVCEPAHRVLDVGDQRGALVEPAGTEPTDLDPPAGVGDMADHLHGVQPVAEPEKRAAVRALVLDEAIRDRLTERREQRADRPADPAESKLLGAQELRQLTVDA